MKKIKTTEKTGDWKDLKARLKRKFPFLTDDDLMPGRGKKEEIFERLQIKTGKTREGLNKIIEEL